MANPVANKELRIRQKNTELKNTYNLIVEKFNQLQTFQKNEQASEFIRYWNKEQHPSWYLDGPETGRFDGINLYALKNFKFKNFSRPVTVAVLDGGVNINHVGIKDYVLINYNETPNNNIDDDKNGYVDDVYGWDFVGKDIEDSSLELTREYARCTYTRNKTPHCGNIIATYNFQRGKIEEIISDLRKAKQRFEQIQHDMKEIVSNGDSHTQDKIKTDALLASFDSKYVIGFERLQPAINRLTAQLEENYSADIEHVQKQTPNYHPNTRFYGSNDVIGTEPRHGTHVAGLVIRIFEEALGGKLNALLKLRILPVRVTPDGDERDEDVANAIRYAVDRGADVIQMSFGKSFSSPRGKQLVDEAVRYAQKKGVLLVHSAGNFGRRTTLETRFPNRFDQQNFAEFNNWIEVGNSTPSSTYSSEENTSLAAGSSNFGELVDVFAPGTDIYSTYSSSNTDNTTYRFMTGTSMAAPIVSGVAAVLKYQFPELDAAALRKIILESSRRYDFQPAIFYEVTYNQAYYLERSARVSGVDYNETEIPFCEASRTGGIVDLYRAVCMASGTSCK